MARSTLAELIDVLRGMTEAAADEWTLGTATFWDSNQLQRILDQHRQDLVFQKLNSTQTRVGGGTIHWLDYYSPYGNLEQTSGGTAVFIVKDATGTTQSTANYSVDYLRGKVSFTSNTGGSTYYITARTYDLDGAALDVWRRKASHYASAFDFKSDNHDVKRSQLYQHALMMVKEYEAKAPPTTTQIWRNDVAY